MPVNNLRGTREVHRIEIESLIMSAEEVVKIKGVPSCPEVKGPQTLSFSSGNHLVDVTRGILHLFKENKATPLGEEAERSDLICMIGVPTSMTTHDLIQFTAPVVDDIESLRIIRDPQPSQYMVLVKFRSQKAADDFYKTFNGAAYNSIEPELCHLVYVEKVETLKENDPKLRQPWTGRTELPTCPVCLERMDESVEGILTILCNHSFHSKCLGSWEDTSCPVCRYSQTPDPVPGNSCFECGSSESETRSNDSLWICLICGHIGCGRYVEGHAYKHYTETQHTYAMQLGNNRVWDYAGDNYVHRLLQNKSDGKMVEVETPSRFTASDEKIDAVQLEYTYLLTNQLETQRRYFEDALTRRETETMKTIQELQEQSQTLTVERDALKDQLTHLTKEKQTLDKKVNQMSQKLHKCLSDLQEEQSLNKCLGENQEGWQKKLKETEDKLTKVMHERDKEIEELKDQVRDLMFFLEAQDKLKNSTEVTAEEMQNSSLVVSPSSSSTSSKASKSKSKKR